MSRRRIAVVSPFIDKRHGTERRVAEFVSRLADEYEFHIYSNRVEDVDLARVVWHRIPALRGPHLLGYLWWLAANHICRWRDRARGIVPDVVYSPGINCLEADAISVHILFAGFYRSMEDQLRLSRNPLAAWPRIIHRRLYYALIAALESRIYNRPVRLAAVSKKTAEDLNRLYPRAADVGVIYNGLDLDCFSPRRRASLRAESRRVFSIRDDEFVLLLIGNDWRNKGLACMLEAMAQLADPRLRALVVGKDSPSAFRALIARVAMDSRVRFCPPRPDVETYYAAADAYVGPSLDDAFAQPPAEAMACGLPVITSRQNGGSEIITHGCDGMILENAADSKALAHMLRMLVNDSALCDRLGAAAAETARRYTWELHAQKMREFLESAAQEKSHAQEKSQR
jgi:UDP-glucose:(heptosyl)LPS alpha-1,3-glucosyltransferase